jgi:hypothetical protein
MLPKLRAFTEYAREQVTSRHRDLEATFAARKPRLKWDPASKRPPPV